MSGAKAEAVSAKAEEHNSSEKASAMGA